MVKKRMLFCSNCVEKTPHTYAGKEPLYEGGGFVRAYMAIFTFGASETSLADYYWQCEHCGKIRKY